jgi:hypothetical protein
MNRWKIATFLIAGLFAAYAFARPEINVSEKLHPNIHAAQDLTAQAWDYMSKAQVANDWDMDGHAGKAKSLLEQAADEMKSAALSANANSKK